MKSQASTQPDTIKFVETDKNTVVWLRENIVEETVIDEMTEEERITYKYDEYKFTLPNRADMQDYLTANFDTLIARYRNKEFAEIKQAKLNQLNTAFEIEAKKPYTTSSGIIMDARELDAQRFSMSMVEALATGDTISDRSVVDYYNVTHTLSFEDWSTLATEIGAKWKDLFLNKKQANRQLILDAETIEELNAIEFTW